MEKQDMMSMKALRSYLLFNCLFGLVIILLGVSGGWRLWWPLIMLGVSLSIGMLLAFLSINCQFRNLSKKLAEAETDYSNLRALFRRVCTQQRMNEVLAELARDFYEAAEREGAVFARVQRGEVGSVSIEDYKTKTQTLKKSFWTAHALAKDLAFTIRKSHKDYLPDDQQAA